MLTGSKTSFKIRQMVPEFKDKILSPSSLNSRNSRDMFGLRCLPGECVLQRAVLVKKKLCGPDGGGWLAGTLFCTHFRVAFVPEDSPPAEDNADPVLLGDHDVALASIEKVVAVGPSRTKVVTPNSSLKFIPEELVLYCRDLRVMRFLFDRLTPEVQAMEITCAIAKTYQPLKPGALSYFQKAALGSVEMKQFLSNRQQDPHVNWFEGAADWERELERTGARGWRVSAVNDRFEMATSLPQFNVVPQRVLDTELKKTFAHFSEGRIPRWCWHHPLGSDLLRMASFQNNIYHEKDDVRNLEMVLFGGQQQCVVVDLAEEMPTPADIQLAHSRLRVLCQGDISASVSVPDEKWLSTLEGTHWLDHVRSCLKKAAEVVCLLRDGHLTVILQEPEDRDLNCLVSSLVQLMSDPHARTLPGFQSLVQKEWITAGHKFLSRLNYQRDSDREESPVFLLFLDCVWQLWVQYPSRFEITGDYLLALHDSAHVPLFISFLANSQRERSRCSQRLSQSYTPVNGWREMLPRNQTPTDPPLPAVWDWALQYSQQRRAAFRIPINTPSAPGTVPNGNLNAPQPAPHEAGVAAPATQGCVFLLSRGSLTSPSHLIPWRGGGGSGSQRKSHRRAPSSSESLPAVERLLKLWTPAESAKTATVPPEHLDSQGPLLPLLLGPCVGVWRGCYLRGGQQTQVCHPAPQHPVQQLALEVQQLGDKLAQVSDGPSKATNGPLEGLPKKPEANLNQGARHTTFLFSPQRAPPPQRFAAPPRPARDSKRTFLFSRAPDANGGPGVSNQRYGPPPTARLSKNSGPSLGS
ncbi:myotubularin-related protein 11 [Amia ocellicauda]|uniref:myotubularin-related protein 11 n=1 Tax=Amia ocellicauda TaxID=2972642 RepID=UPI003463F45D